MPPKGRGRGGGRGNADRTSDGSPSAASPRDEEEGEGGGYRAVGRGAGRGIPDFKENPSRRKAQQSAQDGQEFQPFNVGEVTDWMAARHKAIMDEMDKQKKDKNAKGDFKTYSDLFPERSAWGSARPMIPPKEDFEVMLRQALNNSGN